MTFGTGNLPTGNDVLMGGGGARSASFDGIGDRIGGRIVSKPTSYQVREYSATPGTQGALKFFPSGDPIMGLYVDVQTTLRADSEDDGVRRLYLEKQRQIKAVREAVRAIGADGVEIGGTLYLTWTGTEPGKGNEPAKTWAAEYTPPRTIVPIPGGSPNTGAPAAQPTSTYVHNGNAAPQPSPTYQAPAPANAPTTPMPQQHASAPPAGTGKPQITAAVAAAMANAGVDLNAFDIIPG